MELVTNIFNWVAENGLAVVNALLAVVGGASVIAKLTPTPKDDAFLAAAKAKLDALALNPVIKKK